jgi:ketol-acid reductoisomerase
MAANPPLRILQGTEIAPLAPLSGRTVAVIGYGNQGRAHALNLRDSGMGVIVANRRESDNGRLALADGFDPLPTPEAAARADLAILALPDELHESVYNEQIGPHLRAGSVIGLIHGLSIRFGRILPAVEVGVVLVAPKGPGSLLRARFTQGLGLPALLAVHQAPEEAGGPAGVEAIALAWAGGIGSARSGIILTSFADEAEADLFGEQAVLCGGLTSLILAAFETLVEAGYPPELAYLECCHEVKQIADLVYEGGLASMMQTISNTAEFGAYDAGPRVVDERLRERLREVLAEVRDGRFVQRLRDDHAAGFPWLEQHRRALADHPIETVGAAMRGLTSDTRPSGRRT